jgi:putative transposase
MRLEPDRRHLVLPVIGRLRSKENTRRLQRLVAKGRARVLSMTLAEQGGRLVVSVQAFVAQAPRMPTQPDARCGIDLGIGQEWAVIAHDDDTIQRVAHPAPWAQARKQRRRVARQLSRRTVGSKGHRQTRAKLAALTRGWPTSAPTRPTSSPPPWRADTAPSWWRTSTSRRWAVGWAGGPFAAVSTRPGSARSA